jgi:hypothetical protein
MSWTLTDLTAIENAIKSGTLDVRFSDRRIVYRSLDELLRIRDIIRGDLGLIVDGGRSHRYASHSKGLT